MQHLDNVTSVASTSQCRSLLRRKDMADVDGNLRCVVTDDFQFCQPIYGHREMVFRNNLKAMILF